ncbi:MAG: hypothetical protein ABWZ26_06400 [Candidatus Nanopelagicales bacterium]
MRASTRRVLNAVGLATPLGMLVGVLGRARFTAGPDMLLVAHGYRLRVPLTSAFTIGDVVITPGSYQRLLDQPGLLPHETRHAYQWASWLGLPFLLPYAACAGYSLLRTRNPALGNIFEIRAGLVDGGYVKAR